MRVKVISLSVLLLLLSAAIMAQESVQCANGGCPQPSGNQLTPQTSPATSTIVPRHSPTGVGGLISEYKSMAPDLILIPHREGAPRGRLWVRSLVHGLLIAGEVDGDSPDFPRNKSLILSKDHIEVWMAGTPDVPMPELGWGNQFGQITLPEGEDSCPQWVKQSDLVTKSEKTESKCREWVKKQNRYRVAFKRLFVRQWLLTDAYSIESFATPAYETMVAQYAGDQPMDREEIPVPLKPRGKVQMWYEPTPPRGYTFQIFIPYSSFPPLDTLVLRDLWLMVDVFRSAPEGQKTGPFSTTAPNRQYGKPETFNRLRLQPTRSFQVTPCNPELTGSDQYGGEHEAWFVPQHDDLQTFEADTFKIVNPARGYAYEPEGLSPVVRPIHHFWKDLGPGEWVCGPELAYRKGKKSLTSIVYVEEEGFEAKRLPDGTLLIKSGPRVYGSTFGSGQCGACPRVGLEFFALDKDLKLSEALNLERIVDVGSEEGMDFAISSDWSRVTEFDLRSPYAAEEPGTWSSVTYCLEGIKYEKCGEEKNVQPPEPPVLKEARP